MRKEAGQGEAQKPLGRVHKPHSLSRIISTIQKSFYRFLWAFAVFPSLEALEILENPQEPNSVRIRWRCVSLFLHCRIHETLIDTSDMW